MARLPENPNFKHLKKQAKDLLRLYQNNDPVAFERFRCSLPAAAGKSDTELAAMDLKLHDSQSTIAREYGLPSWRNLRNNVDWRNAGHSGAREDAVPLWLHQVYGHENDRPNPRRAAQMLEEHPDLGHGDLMLSCAIGDESAVRAAIESDADCAGRIGNPWLCPGCKQPLGMPPLVALTHSSLIRLPQFHDRMVRCARLLLDAGADPNQSYPQQSAMSGNYSLRALFGAAGKNHDPELTRMLLDAGANPNDNESLYHSTETRDHTCMRMLLEAGAIVENSNALHHQLDVDDIDGLQLLLRYTSDVNHSTTIGPPLLWAIRRGRSRAYIEALLAAGANPRVQTKDGVSAWRLALQYGLRDAAEALDVAGADETLSIEDQFVAACSCCDATEARRIVAAHPDIFGRLSYVQLRQLPNLTETGNHEAVRLMVELGWPVGVPGGDWHASALNLAVF